MKKFKGVAVAMEYSPYAMYEDQRTRFKHKSLMRDFQDLHKETEAMRTKLEMMEGRKLTILAEVRFLKRRREFLMQNRSLNILSGRNFVQPQNAVVRSKSNAKEKKSTGREHSKLNVKLKNLTHPSPMFDLNQKQHKSINGKEDVILGSSQPILDLKQRERLLCRKKATARTTQFSI